MANEYRTVVLAALCFVSLAVAGAAISSTVIAENGGIETLADLQDEETGITLENLSAPEEVQLGTNYTVSADVVNRNDSQRVQRVSYQIAGSVIATQLVEIPANNTTTVEFEVAGNETEGLPLGTFTHGVYAGDANATANLTLVADAQAPEEETPTPDDEATPTPEEETTTTPEEEETTTPEEGETTTPEGETTTPEEETTTPEETSTPEETPTPEAETASVTFESQSSNGSEVMVDSVAVPEGGFVVVHDVGVTEGEAIESILGTSEYLDRGTQENVTVELDEPLNESQRLVAVVYRDSNENQEYDFVTSNRTADGPYRQADGRAAVNDFANVTVENDGEQEDDEA
jgi:cytoskeletal protein RodZ